MRSGSSSSLIVDGLVFVDEFDVVLIDDQDGFHFCGIADLAEQRRRRRGTRRGSSCSQRRARPVGQLALSRSRWRGVAGGGSTVPLRGRSARSRFWSSLRSVQLLFERLQRFFDLGQLLRGGLVRGIELLAAEYFSGLRAGRSLAFELGDLQVQVDVLDSRPSLSPVVTCWPA